MRASTKYGVTSRHFSVSKCNGKRRRRREGETRNFGDSEKFPFPPPRRHLTPAKVRYIKVRGRERDVPLLATLTIFLLTAAKKSFSPSFPSTTSSFSSFSLDWHLFFLLWPLLRQLFFSLQDFVSYSGGGGGAKRRPSRSWPRSSPATTFVSFSPFCKTKNTSSAGQNEEGQRAR